MDAQEMHDYEMLQRGKAKAKLAGKKELEASLAARNGSSLEPSQSDVSDPIEMAVRNNPSLTREKAEEMAEKLGY